MGLDIAILGLDRARALATCNPMILGVYTTRANLLTQFMNS